MPPQSDLTNTVSADGDSCQSFSQSNEEADVDPPPDHDLPPESFWIPKEHELDWLNRNAFIERKGSTKATLNLTTNSSSQRPSPTLESKPSIIRLPNSCFACGKFRRPENVRLFRTRSEPNGKPVVQVAEPGSPRVSCMGRVGSKNGRGNRTGFWTSLKEVFRTRFQANRAANYLRRTELAEPEMRQVGKRLGSGMRSESWGRR
ncbi:uncharacterized protein LOC132268574 [Cornus florida]|uniref:uncharacterized protein LOC132268574 n=1 Tax=Cornus florida TaxID=4283 RepID=UPI002896E315|nr:uncharacterized protein LOC132268574 [Cornus florida]